MKSPPSREQVWTLHYTPNKFPSASSDMKEYSQPELRCRKQSSRKLRTRKIRSQSHAKSVIPVPVAQRVPVAVGTAAIDRIVVPRTTTLHSEVPAPSPPSRLYEKNGYSFNFSEKRLFVNPRNPVFPKNRVSEFFSKTHF